MKKLILTLIVALYSVINVHAIDFKKKEQQTLKNIYKKSRVNYSCFTQVKNLIESLSNKITNEEINTILEAGIPFEKRGRRYNQIIKRKVNEFLGYEDCIFLRKSNDRSLIIVFLLGTIEEFCSPLSQNKLSKKQKKRKIRGKRDKSKY